MRALLAAAALLALAAPLAQAKPTPAAEAGYVVTEADVRIRQYPLEIRGQEITADGEVLLRGRQNRWYRMALNESCARQLSRSSTLVFNTAPSDVLDRSAIIYFEGGACIIRSLHRVVPPAGH